MMLASARHWFDERTARERVLLLAMAVLALVWLLYAGIWQPLQAREAALLAQIDRHERAVAMLRAAPVVQTQTAATDTRPVPMIVTDTAAAFSLTIRRLEPEGDGARVILDEVAFEAVVFWLDRLEQNHGLRVTTIEMTRRPAPGVVTATLTLQR
jgi:type II secretory pathway component PulM